MKNILFNPLPLILCGIMVCSCGKDENFSTDSPPVVKTKATAIVDYQFEIRMDIPEDLPNEFAVEIININPGQEGITTYTRSMCPRGVYMQLPEMEHYEQIGVMIVPTIESMPYIDGFWDHHSGNYPSSHNDTYHYGVYYCAHAPRFVTPIFRAPNRPAYTRSAPLVHIGVRSDITLQSKIIFSALGDKYKPYYGSNGILPFDVYCLPHNIVDNVLTSTPLTFEITNRTDEPQTFTISSSILNRQITLNSRQKMYVDCPLDNVTERLLIFDLNY